MERISRLERLTAVLRQRGIILPAFEIHGGAAGLFDFGPIGGRLRNKVNQAWINHWLSQGDIVELSCPTITPYQVLEASGHVGEFSDFLTTCNNCEEASRADTLLETVHPSPDSLNREELEKLLFESDLKCPSCEANDWSEVTAQNLMFNTTIGAGKSGRHAFLRPETAQGMFTNFPSLFRHFRQRLPFGAIQVGKGYRNEISPRQGMIRLREFNMAELEYFIDPETPIAHDFTHWKGIKMNLIPDQSEQIQMTIVEALDAGIIRHPTVGYFLARTFQFLVNVGIDPTRMRFRQHESDEMAHYATDCWDIEIDGSYGWIECVGIAHRGCYDLQAHEEYTGQRLRAWRAYDEPRHVNKEILTIDGSIVGPVFKHLVGQVKNAVENLTERPAAYPFILSLESGEEVEIEEVHVKVKVIDETIAGEWYLPHVVEPAVGIDRIIWHIIDHAWDETVKSGEQYNIMRLNPSIAPIDVSVFPLFEKDGMGVLAANIHQTICSTDGLISNYDASGSIGRRYARADEIGVPFCITVDHQSLEDNTVTVRVRDSQEQTRVCIDDIVSFLN